MFKIFFGAHALSGPATLSPNNCAHSHTCQAATFGVPISINSCAHDHSAGVVTFAQNHIFVSSDCLHSDAAQAASFSQNHIFVVTDAAHAEAAAADTFTQNHIYVCADGAHGHAADSVTYSQNHVFVSGNCLHDHTGQVVTFGGLVFLTPDPTGHSMAASSPTLLDFTLDRPALRRLDLAARVHEAEIDSILRELVVPARDKEL